MTLIGTDISQYQPTADWSKMQTIAFSVAKATEGTGFVDQTYKSHDAGARSAGLIPGAYHWLSPGGNDAAAQCDHFLSVISNPDGLLIQLDCEQNGLTYGDITAWMARWNQRVPGHPVFIYAGVPFWTRLGNHDGASLGPWWLPNYPGGKGYPGDAHPVWSEKIGGWKRPTIWQWGSLHIPGFPAGVDGDAFKGTRDELLAFTGLAGAGPAQGVHDVIYSRGGLKTAVIAAGTPYAHEPAGPTAGKIGTTGRYLLAAFDQGGQWVAIDGNYLNPQSKVTTGMGWVTTAAVTMLQDVIATDCTALVTAATAEGYNAGLTAARAALIAVPNK